MPRHAPELVGQAPGLQRPLRPPAPMQISGESGATGPTRSEGLPHYSRRKFPLREN